jgi:hypothetical protein
MSRREQTIKMYRCPSSMDEQITFVMTQLISETQDKLLARMDHVETIARRHQALELRALRVGNIPRKVRK